VRTSFKLLETGSVAGELRWRTRHAQGFPSTETCRPAPIPVGLREKMARSMEGSV